MSPDGLFFQTTGDRQLWQYQVGKEWTIPVFATPGQVGPDPYWLILPAVYLSAPGWHKLESVLDDVSIHAGHDFWVVKPSDFTAKKCHGVTPEYYLRYPDHGSDSATGFSSRPLTACLQPPFPDDDFVMDVWKRTGICDLPTLRLVFHTIKQELPRYLLASGKPVLFGWMDLRAFPYRANWKQILLAKFPKILSVFRNKEISQADELNRIGFKSAHSSTSLMAIDKKGTANTIGWTVECDLQPNWDLYVAEYERDVLAVLRRDRYFKRVTTLFLKARKASLDVFKRWVEQTARPCGSVIHDRTPSANRLAPALRADKLREQAEGDASCAITSPPDAEALHDIDGTPVVDEEIEELPPLPVIQLKPKDVWHHIRDLPPERQS